MKRIGIAASKMAKGNLLAYNLFVILLSFLFSFCIFLIAGSSVLLAIFVIGCLMGKIMPLMLKETWLSAITILTSVVGLFNLFALLTNIKFAKKDIFS